MFFTWPAQKPEPQGRSRRRKRRQNAENKMLGGYMNHDGTYSENFQKAIANEPLPKPVNPFGRPVLPQREANAPRYKKLKHQLRDNALVKKQIPKGEDDALATIVGTDDQGRDIVALHGYDAVWDDDMETVIGHMDWQNGIAVPLGHAFPSSDAQMTNDTEVGKLPPKPGVQLAGAIPMPFPLPPPAAPGQPPEENQQFPQGPGTIPMEQAQEIEKWILEGIQELKDKLPWNRADEQESISQPATGSSDGRADPSHATVMESRGTRNEGKKPSDSSKNEPHGDGGRAHEKAKKRHQEIEKAIQEAPNKKERNKLIQKKRK